MHLLFILLLWTALIAAMFYSHDPTRAHERARFQHRLRPDGGAGIAALILLRIGALAMDPVRMFRRTAVGDLLLVLALAIAGPVFWLARDQILFLCALLGAVLMLQTHVPLLDDEDLDPPGLKDHLPVTIPDAPEE